MKLATRTSGAISRPLKILIPLIKNELEAGDTAGIEHYRAAGEMLLEAKEQVAQGEWGGWLKRNFSRSADQARKYMNLAGLTKTARERFSTLSDFAHPNRDRAAQVAWHAPVRDIASRVNVGALAQERQNRENERKLLRQLSH